MCDFSRLEDAASGDLRLWPGSGRKMLPLCQEIRKKGNGDRCRIVWKIWCFFWIAARMKPIKMSFTHPLPPKDILRTPLRTGTMLSKEQANSNRIEGGYSA